MVGLNTQIQKTWATPMGHNEPTPAPNDDSDVYTYFSVALQATTDAIISTSAEC